VKYIYKHVGPSDPASNPQVIISPSIFKTYCQEIDMSALTRLILYKSKLILSIFFVLGVVVLLGTWTVLYWTESLFTESHLVGYYCCVTEQDLPAPGTLERTASDFFRTSPGMHLPSLVFVTVNASIFVISVWYARRKDYWWLPFLFIAFSILYVLVDFWLVSASWSISDWLVGPQTSAYKGYHRTWYGIVLHLMLWCGFFIGLSRMPVKLKVKSQAIDRRKV